MTRRAISPPPGSAPIPRLASLRAPADMTPTVPPPGAVVRELESARQALVRHATVLRAVLRTMGCDPRELTGVLAAIEQVIEEENRRRR